jgi:hypothetical protein
MDDRPVAPTAPTKPVRWWKRIGAVVLGAGGIAAAVTAIVTAVQTIHPPDKEEFAAFGDVTIRTGVPVSEYKQRVSPPKPLSKSLGGGASKPWPVLVAATGSASTPAPSPTTRRTSPATKKPTVEPSNSGRTLPDLDRSFIADQGSVRAVQTDGQKGTVPPDVCEKQPLVCKIIIIGTMPTDAEGNTLSEEKAKAAYDKVVKNSRTVSVKKSKKNKKKREMLGVVVNVNIELSGLRGKRVLLSWTFWRGDGDTQVYGTWLNDNYAYELVAGSDHDSGGVDFWIPLPKEKGPYFIRSKLPKDGQVLATHDSQQFS